MDALTDADSLDVVRGLGDLDTSIRDDVRVARGAGGKRERENTHCESPMRVSLTL